MADKKEKTLSYRRAVWLEDAHGLTLEKLLKEAHLNLKTIEDRTIVHGGQHTKSIKPRELSSGGMYLHLTVDTPGEYASVVPKAEHGESELDLTVVSPPADGEWLDGDAFLFVRHNHVCLCSTGLRDAAVAAFIYSFFQKARLRQDATRFQLLKVADVSKIKMMHRQGVKEVQIKATMFQATSTWEKRQAHAYGILGAAAKQFKKFIKKPNDFTREGLQIILSIKSDHRFSEFKLGEKQIEDVAADILKNGDELDEFTIITKTGQKIGPNEIFMRSTVSIDSDGKTVDRDKAWRELSHFYKTLHDAGFLEQ